MKFYYMDLVEKSINKLEFVKVHGETREQLLKLAIDNFNCLSCKNNFTDVYYTINGNIEDLIQDFEKFAENYLDKDDLNYLKNREELQGIVKLIKNKRYPMCHSKEKLLNTLNNNLKNYIEKQASWDKEDLAKMLVLTPAVIFKDDNPPEYKVLSIELCKELSKLLVEAYRTGYLDDDDVHKMKLAFDKEELMEIYEQCGDEPEAFITSYVYLELEPKVIKGISQVV